MPGHPRALLGAFCLLASLEAAPEFSGYLQKVLRSRTAHACDGEQLSIVCPQRTTISILAAFYGRRVPSRNLCPTSGDPPLESVDCVAATARQKVMDECQGQAWCHFLVHRHVFGPDPCPGTRKYLVVSYKCRPANHRLKTACESQRLRLQCRSKAVLVIYSAAFGRPSPGKPECDSALGRGTNLECLAPDTLRRVTRRCHRKANCTLVADEATFGAPCVPGVKKQLRVSYTCVPRQLLEEVAQHGSQQDPFSITDDTHGGWYTGPRLSRLQENLMVFTNFLETFAHIWGVPEKAGVYFLCGVSGGLLCLLLLLLFAPQAALLRDLKASRKAARQGADLELQQRRPQDEADEPDGSSSDSSFQRLACACRGARSIFGPELAAALEGAAAQGGPEGGAIWIPKESSPYAIHRLQAAAK